MTDEHLVIVMEYASGGHLEERITTGGRLSEAKARIIFKQILDAVDYCHRCATCIYLQAAHINAVP